MKIGQKEIYRIQEIALDKFRDQSPNLSWIKNRGEISPSERRALAYTEAVSAVLGLEIDVEYFKQVAKGAWVKKGEIR